MKECSKALARRLADSNFTTRYFRGSGIDIGGRPDPLALYRELFPLVDGIRTWDREDGDAQLMAGVADDSYDFVHASHCLEHTDAPHEAMQHWFRILRPGGHLIVTVPDEDLYEQGRFPSSFNRDHKWTFTLWKGRSWSHRSINLLELVTDLGWAVDVRKLEVIDHAFRYDLPRYDQTLSPVCESAIELVVRKRPVTEVNVGGRLPQPFQPGREVRLHLNQYRDDHAAMKTGDPGVRPFENDSEL